VFMATNVGASRAGHQRLTQPSRHAVIGVRERADIILVGVPRQRYPDRLAREQAQSHRRQHMAGRHLAGAARGTRADGNPCQVESDHLRIGTHARQGDTRCIDKPGRASPANHRLFRQGRSLERVAERSQMRRFARGRRGGSETGNRGQCGRAAATPALLATTGDQWRDRCDVRRHQQGPGADRTAQLVGGNRHTVCASIGKPDIHPPGGLHRINVQQRTMLSAESGGRLDGLDRAGLVVRQHQADQRRGLVRQELTQCINIGDAVAVDPQDGRARRR
jgi:hypothetical protein